MILAMTIVPMAAVVLAQFGRKAKSILLPNDWHKVSLKPFDCAFCLSWWINIILHTHTMPDQSSWVIIILVSLASSIVAAQVEKHL